MKKISENILSLRDRGIGMSDQVLPPSVERRAMGKLVPPPTIITVWELSAWTPKTRWLLGSFWRAQLTPPSIDLKTPPPILSLTAQPVLLSAKLTLRNVAEVSPTCDNFQSLPPSVVYRTSPKLLTVQM